LLDVRRDLRERPRRLRRLDRRLHAPADGAGDDPERPPVPQRAGGDLMAAIEAPVLAPPQTLAARLVRIASRSPVHIALLGLGIIWLVPTIGLAVTSFRPKSDILSN